MHKIKHRTGILLLLCLLLPPILVAVTPPPKCGKESVEVKTKLFDYHFDKQGSCNDLLEVTEN